MENRASRALVPTIEELIKLKNPNNVSDFLEAFHAPVEKIGLALHTEFSGINFRGIKTHDVRIRYSGSGSWFSDPDSVFSAKNQTLISSSFQPNEFEEGNQVLRLFLNELKLSPSEILEGFIRLENTQEDIPRSTCPFSVGIIITPEALKQGKSGFIVSSSGELELFPRVKEDMGRKQFRSELEGKNYELFLGLRNVSVGEIKHPLVERLITECAFFIGKAVVNRKIKSEFI